MLYSSAALPAAPNKVNLKNIKAWEQLRNTFSEQSVQKNIDLDLALLDCYASELSKIERYTQQQAKQGVHPIVIG